MPKDFDYLDGDDFGNSHKKVARRDVLTGKPAAGPTGNYEGSLDPHRSIEFGPEGVTEFEGGTLHAGHIKPDGYRRRHGDNDEHGFVRRPTQGGDVERN